MPPPADNLALGRIALRALIGFTVAAALVWGVVPITVAGVHRQERPELVLAVDRVFGAAPDARAAAVLAKRMLGDGRNRGPLAGARAMAAAALRRDPTVVDAVAVIGLATALGQAPDQAERAFVYADQLSRRDIGTQLWLIERAVQRNDIPATLRHYDTVLRVSPPMATQLFPVLSQASRVPGIAVALNTLLNTRPNWGRDFLSFMLRGQSDPRAIFLVSRGLVSPNDPGEREHLGLLLRALTAARAFDFAWQAYVAAWPARARGSDLLWNGDFSTDPGAPPFDWGFAEDPSQAPERRARRGGDIALYLPTGANAEAEVARQLVQLAPGSYALAGTAGGVADDPDIRPFVTISCDGTQSTSLARQDLPVSPESGRPFGLRFTVPGSCTHQWVSIHVRGNFDRQLNGNVWIDSLAITRG